MAPEQATATPEPVRAGSRKDEKMTPEKREELLAAVAMATASRVADPNADIQTRTLVVDTAESD